MAKLVKTIIGGDDFLTEVLVRGLTVKEPADAYCVGHCNEKLGRHFQAKYEVHYLPNFVEMIPNSAILFLAFAPEETKTLLPRIAEKVQEWTLIVSAVRDLNLETLSNYLPHNEIVRLAVNPSIISGKGLSAYALSQNASIDANSIAEIVLKECGDVIAVKNETELEEISKFLTANTYLSYVVIRTMIKNAKKVGMTPKEANVAVDKLLRGSMRTLIDFGYDTADLLNRGLKDNAIKGEAIDLIQQYGIADELVKELNHPEPEEKINPNDDPKNFRMHYQWSGH